MTFSQNRAISKTTHLLKFIHMKIEISIVLKPCDIVIPIPAARANMLEMSIYGLNS